MKPRLIVGRALAADVRSILTSLDLSRTFDFQHAGKIRPSCVLKRLRPSGSALFNQNAGWREKREASVR